MALFQRNNNSSQDSEKFDNYVENLVSDSDPDITTEIESHFNAPKPKYSIEDAIELMRKLPQENSDMVMTVVRETLTSANIDVDEIIRNADSKSIEIEKNIHSLSMEINRLEKQVTETKEAVESAQESLTETQQVKALLIKSQETVAKSKVSKVENLPKAKPQGNTSKVAKSDSYSELSEELNASNC